MHSVVRDLIGDFKTCWNGKIVSVKCGGVRKINNRGKVVEGARRTSVSYDKSPE